MKISASKIFNICLFVFSMLLAGCSISPIELQRSKSAELWNELILLYQQRSDLITYMVELMLEEYDHDSGVLIVVQDSNAKFILMQTKPNVMTDSLVLFAFEKANSKLTMDLTNMLLILKNPIFQSNRELMDITQDFSVLQEKIMMARNAYVDSVKIHNQILNKFPNNLIGFFYDYSELPLLQQGLASSSSLNLMRISPIPVVTH